jgi:hypothetical protein
MRKPARSFFLPGTDCGLGYLNVRRSRFLRPAKLYVEHLWQTYAPYADQHFRQDARKHFLQRYWEMYLTVALIDAGFTPTKLADEGPEFFIELEGRRVWVKAIAPGGGEGPDKVPEFPPGTAFNVPAEQVLLRYTHALAEKRTKYLRNVRKGIIGPDDGYIVAINCREIPHARYGGVIPYALQAFLPFGPLTAVYVLRKGQITDRYFTKRESISKLKGTQIPTTAFLDPAYACVSAIIHSAVDAANSPVVLGADLFVLHNPLASQPIPTKTFSRWRQYVFADDQIRMIESNPRLKATRRKRATASPASRRRMP